MEQLALVRVDRTWYHPWVLNGLEVTVMGAIGVVLRPPKTLGLSSAQIGFSGTPYLAGKGSSQEE